MYYLAALTGKVIRGVGLGLLLVAAILSLLALAGDIPVFRYQGF